MPDCHSDSKTVKQCTKTRDDGYAQCKETRDEGYSECSQWADQGYNQCSQWADNGYSECSQYQDQGYSACAEWADQGYDRCCDWWPCSWGCKAYVWVSSWVCVLNVWFSSWVCVGWTWISHWVCMAAVWVASWVCLAWVWVSHIVCVVWVWIKNVVCVAWAIIVLLYITLCCTLSKKTVGFYRCLFWIPKHTPRNNPIKPGWILTFEDDFNSGVIDNTKWIDHISYIKRYNKKRYYSPNFTFGKSTVKLIADNTPFTITNPDPDLLGGQVLASITLPYTLAALQWRADPLLEQRHGYFEIRCKSQNARDMWPAFWLFPVSPDPSLGPPKTHPPELDIFEFMSGSPEVFTTTQHWGQDPGHPSEGKNHRACRAGKYFHIYACEWDEEKISWYLDNHLLRTTTKGIQDFIYPMSVVINTQVDDRDCRKPERSQYPNWLEVDYVRVYKKL